MSGKANPGEGGNAAPSQSNATAEGKAPSMPTSPPEAQAAQGGAPEAPEAQGGSGGPATADANAGNSKGASRSARNRKNRKAKRDQNSDSSKPNATGPAPPEAEWQQVKRKDKSKRSAPRSESQAPPKKSQASSGSSKGSSKPNSAKGKSVPPKGAAGPSAGKAQSGRAGQASGLGGFKIPKKTYAQSAGKKQNMEENGDLPEEEEARIKAAAGGKGIPLYVHTSRDKRLPITSEQFDFVYERVHMQYVADLDAGNPLVADVAICNWKFVQNRGIFFCMNKQTIDYLTEFIRTLVSDAESEEPTFYGAWERGTFGTTLVTVMLVDHHMPKEVLEKLIIKCNGLTGPLYNLITRNLPERLRKITFGVNDSDAATLRAIKAGGMFRVGILLARFTIGKDPSTGTPEASQSGNRSQDTSEQAEPMETGEESQGGQAEAEAAKAAAQNAEREAAAVLENLNK